MGEAGCAWGVWSTEAVFSLDRAIAEGLRGGIPGMERFPKNLINGVRSAAAEACRRALVANIFESASWRNSGR